MKGYGLPRNDDVAHPDCGDLRFYGLQSSAGHLRGKGGDIRGLRTSGKRKARRRWKKMARREGKAMCREEKF